MDVLHCSSTEPHQHHQHGLIPSPNASLAPKKKSRLSYSINFKLAAVRHAESHGNRATARYLGINEKQIRDWRSKKSSLMNTNANAKRLKGAGRQCSDSNKRHSKGTSPANGRHNSLNSDNSNKKYSPSLIETINHQPHHRQQSRYDFSWWRQCLPHSEPAIMKQEIRNDSFSSSLSPSNSSSCSNNNNNNYVTHSIKSIIEEADRKKIHQFPPQLHFSSNSHHMHHQVYDKNDEGEQELNEKISCALALLELKKTSKKHGSFDQFHQYPVITWWKTMRSLDS